MKTYFRALSIAGSDSGGGAGVQADLKTFSALGVYGMTAITAITAQNTKEVRSIFPVDAVEVKNQIDCVVEDIGVDAIKVGMVFNSECVHAIYESLVPLLNSNVIRSKKPPLVLDPVMISKSGTSLLKPETISELKQKLFPLTTLITPNIPEAEVLTDMKIDSLKAMEGAAQKLLTLGPRAILIKGGHSTGNESNDLLVTSDSSTWLRAPRITTKNTHGTGCTLSAAITGYLAKGYTLSDSVALAKKFLQTALTEGALYQLGEGHGPLYHFIS